MLYVIKYKYKTGDSFGSEKRDGEIEYRWTNLDMAKKSLARIKNHYEFYCEYDSSSFSSRSKDQILKELSDKDWFVNENKQGLRPESFWQFAIYLVSDTGTNFDYHVPWCGYFEHLLEIEIDFEKEEDTKVVFDKYYN
jgi:hypothetical protein